jgi:DNA-binding XRE family transcriptional regulator
MRYGYVWRNFWSRSEFRLVITTAGYAVGNLVDMRRPLPGYRKSKAQRRRTFLAAWRDFRGMTQDFVAEQLETTKATVSRIESGEMPYSQDYLESLADLLGVHPGVLVTRAPMDADRIPTPPERPRPSRRQ